MRRKKKQQARPTKDNNGKGKKKQTYFEVKIEREVIIENNMRDELI